MESPLPQLTVYLANHSYELRNNSSMYVIKCWICAIGHKGYRMLEKGVIKGARTTGKSSSEKKGFSRRNLRMDKISKMERKELSKQGWWYNRIVDLGLERDLRRLFVQYLILLVRKSSDFPEVIQVVSDITLIQAQIPESSSELEQVLVHRSIRSGFDWK